jgi:hypothetical protein
MFTFELLGWDNLGDIFPAEATPIGRWNGQLVAYYPGGKHKHPIYQDAVFTHLTLEELQGPFMGFNPEEERLFADSKTKVVRTALMSLEEYKATVTKR